MILDSYQISVSLLGFRFAGTSLLFTVVVCRLFCWKDVEETCCEVDSSLFETQFVFSTIEIFEVNGDTLSSLEESITIGELLREKIPCLRVSFP